MKKKSTKLLISAIALCAFGVSMAETVYINGRAVSPSIINSSIAQVEKSSPMMASQINSNPRFKEQLLQSIGMQQAILMEGNKSDLGSSQAYKDKIQQVKPMIYAQILQDRISNTPVTEAQIEAKYNQMKTDAANRKQYEASHILVKDLATANSIETQLKNGANFAALARKYSIDPGSKNKGGDLGWSDGSNYVPEFSAALKKLQKGQYTTTPVKTQFGYHIIKLNDVRSSSTSIASLNQMRAQIKQQIQTQRVRDFFDGLKSKYHIEVK